jgi:hypothetical protein
MKKQVLAFLVALSMGATGQSETVLVMLAATASMHAGTGFREIHVNASKVTGTIRSFQGVNGVPTPIMTGLPNLEKQYKKVHMDMIRTHDTMGQTDVSARFSMGNVLLACARCSAACGTGGGGNAAAIFPDWSGDSEKSESYNFGPTDRVIEGIRAAGAEVYYRIGRSFGADDPPLPAIPSASVCITKTFPCFGVPSPSKVNCPRM